MDTASGLVFLIGRRMAHLGVALAIAAALLMALAFIAAAVIVGLLQPASEVVLVAPLRW